MTTMFGFVYVSYSSYYIYLVDISFTNNTYLKQTTALQRICLQLCRFLFVRLSHSRGTHLKVYNIDYEFYIPHGFKHLKFTFSVSEVIKSGVLMNNVI